MKYVTLAAVALTLTTSACQKVADEKADYGAEVSRADITRAFAAAMNGVHTRDTRVGANVVYTSTRRIDDANGELDLGLSSVSVVALTAEAPARKAFRLVIDKQTRGQDGGFKAERNEAILAVDLVGARATPVATPMTNVTYHRLRTATETLRAPAAVRARPHCGGLPNCELTVRYVLFDVVTRAPGAEPRRASMTMGFSPQTPYLPHGEGFDRFDGALVVDCRASNVKFKSKTVSVRDCRTLADFQK